MAERSQSTVPSVRLLLEAGDEYLIPFEEHELTQAEREAFWHVQFYSLPAKLNACTTQRIWVAWRLTRMMALLKGVILPNQSLAEGTATQPSPWSSPLGCFPEADWTDATVQRLSDTHTPLLPVARRDLPAWLVVAEIVADRMGLHRNPEAWEVFQLMRDPDAGHEAWPTPNLIMQAEDVIVEDVLQKVLDSTEAKVGLELRREGYYEMEVGSLIALARTRAKGLVGHDTQADRAMMVLRLEKLAVDAANDADLRLRLQTLKALSVVQGLGDSPTSAEVEDMAIVAKALPPAVRAQLPEGDE